MAAAHAGAVRITDGLADGHADGTDGRANDGGPIAQPDRLSESCANVLANVHAALRLPQLQAGPAGQRVARVRGPTWDPLAR